MRLEWLEDLIAIQDEGSLNKAAECRYLTQPAFSRRIRAIEQYVGVELIDRSHKPAQLRPAVSGKMDEIRDLVFRINELVFELRRNDKRNRVVIACQHAITTSVAPELVKMLSGRLGIEIRLRSANRDECHGLLITKQADLTITYVAADESESASEEYLEFVELGEDMMLPVFAADELPALNEAYAMGELPIVTYPPEVFLGQVLKRNVLEPMRQSAFLQKKVETALTLAAMQFAQAGIGIAWVPSSLVRDGISKGLLADLSHFLPTQKLNIVASRLAGKKTPTEEDTWRAIRGFADEKHESGGFSAVDVA